MNQTLQNKEQQSCCANGTSPRRVFRPVADVITSDHGVTLRVDLPGARESDVDVTLDRDTLSIRARVEPPKQEGLTPLLTEYHIGDYERKFRIAEEIDRENIEATFRNGVLTLKLARTKAAGPTKVKITGG
jgi:HSP20 family molecular chaperone IbpA